MKTYNFKAIIRIVLILINMILISWIFGDDRLFFNQIILFAVLIIQIAELIRFINYTNRELTKFLLAIRHEDYSMNFKKSFIGQSFKELNEAFEKLISTYKTIKTEQEAQFQYLKMVVSHINTGIISIEEDINITLMNEPAEKLLQVKGINSWTILKEKVPLFAKEIEQLGDGRKLIELDLNGEPHTLSVDVSSMIMLDKQYKLITLQDIKNEIEQKEIEAWHKLIRILTHEIMNSATPISSLTETMQQMLAKNGEPVNKSDISDETIEDLLFSLKTIQKRSDGMLAFIDDYRKITKVPKPNLEITDLAKLINGLAKLINTDLSKHNIHLELSLSALHEPIAIDPKLIEQVLLNLIKNSQQALVNVSDPQIKIEAIDHHGLVIIDIADNGRGIPEKELKQIFVPFYTTKKDGSGIGLSLSKQIMHLHHGSIKVKSDVNTGTTFSLIFHR